jgi:hypothetical protein
LNIVFVVSQCRHKVFEAPRLADFRLFNVSPRCFLFKGETMTNMSDFELPPRLSIPAMSAENERFFSSSKDLVSDRRNALDIESIEANECIRNWTTIP